jgi:hypothetical protein
MIKSLIAVFAILAFLWTPLTRADEPASVAGKWHFVFDTEGGDRSFDVVLEQNADKITGKWAVDVKPNGDPVSGTYTDKKLSLEIPLAESEAGPGTMKLTGSLGDDGLLTGGWAFQDYSGTYKATRVKDQPAKTTP